MKPDNGENPAVGKKSKTHPVTGCVLVLFILFVSFPFWMPFLSKLRFVERVRSGPCWKLEADEALLAQIDTSIEGHSRAIGPFENGDGEIYYDFVGRFEHGRDADGDGVEDTIGLYSGHELVIESSRRGKTYGSPSGGTSVGFDDVDADGALDAWCCDPGDGLMRVFYGDGKGRFREKQWILDVWGGATGSFFDVDGDGDLDVVMKVDHKALRDEPDRPTDYFWIQLELKGESEALSEDYQTAQKTVGP
jgi:VCBS repeat protein